MKLKLLCFLTLTLLLNQKTYSQYKDLEGVFFGKVIGLGMGASIQKYGDKTISGASAFTPITYSVFLNNKAVSSMSLGLHKKITAKFNGNDGITDYSQTAEIKLLELEVAYRYTLTKDGIGKPFSVFLNFQTGFLRANIKINDSRYGEWNNEQYGRWFAGAGLTLYQRIGPRFIAFAEPLYRYVFAFAEEKIYLGENYEKEVKLNHFKGQVGILFLIGKKE